MVQSRRMPRPTSDPLKTLADEVADLRKQIAQLQNGATSSGAVVRSKAMLVKEGAAIEVRDENDASRFYQGKLDGAFASPAGNNQTGMVFRRQDGSLVFAIADPLPTEDGFRQYWGLYDMQGHLLFGDDVNSEDGIASPWLTIPMYPMKLDQYVSTTSGSFEVMYAASGHRRQNPYVSAMAWVQCPAGTVGEVRLRANGVTMDSAVCTANNWTNYTLGPQKLPLTFGAEMDINIEARRTGGSGTVKVGIGYVRGQQSP